jgi:catechol 2,3-dioxygenase-like lactoylglutathione lyase family enzyme
MRYLLLAASGTAMSEGIVSCNARDDERMQNFIQITPFMHVKDIEEAVRFFVDLLGFEAWWHESSTYAYVSRDGVAIRIMSPGTDGPGTRGFRYYIDVKDVVAVVAELTPKLEAHWPGRRVHGPVDQEYGQREFMIEAPDGDLVVFGQSIFEMPLRK